MEYRDLYDENRNLTGETITKEQEIPKGKYIIIVACVMENSQGKFLMQKRSPLKGGKWGITGGHPKTKETSLEGMHTEILEELGLDISPSELTLCFTAKDDKRFADIYYLKKDINIKDITMQESEVSDVKWFTKEEIENLYQQGNFKTTHYHMFKDFLKTK